MVYTNEEAFQMLMVLGECHQNFHAAERIFSARFPNFQHQSRKSFERLTQRLRTTGNVQPQNKRTRNHVVREENTPDVLAALEVNPHASTRELSTDSGISQSSICRILKNSKMHPYHISLHQELEEDDFLHRINFSVWAQNKLLEDPNFAHNVLWCDEATFKSNGNVNRHNMHYWSKENPHWMREINHQRQWTLNTWCGIYDGNIIGPHFFENNLNGQIYNDFLSNEFIQLLHVVPIRNQRNMWFMQDGSPPHFAIDVRQTITAMFGDNWIGRGGPISWPARSPDLTVMDFYLWGRVKEMVYRTSPTTRENMKERIRRACREISGAEIRHSVNNFPKRIELCLHFGGRQFEHFL